MSKLLRQNVGGTDYTMVGCTLSATCATAAATAAKVAELTDGDVLADGMSVAVQFTNGNTAASPLTLTVGGVTANICDSRGQNIGGNIWQAGNVVTFLYTFGKFLLLNCVVDEVTLNNMNSVSSNAVATQTVRYIGNAHGMTLTEIYNTYSKQNRMVYRGWLDWNDSRCPLYGQGANTVEIACYDFNLIAYSLDGRVWYYSMTDGWQQSNNSGTASLISTYATSGAVNWQKSGRLVLVNLGNVALSEWSDGDKIIGTGLPKAQISISCAIPPLNSTDSAQLFEVTRAGELRTNGGSSHRGVFYGSFCYISES